MDIMIIDKDMLKDIEHRDFVLIKHEVYVDDEVKVHWDIRVPEISKEWSLVSDPIENDNILGIERILRPDPTTIPNTATNIDSGRVDIIKTNGGNDIVLGGEKIKGTWNIVKDKESKIPNAVRFTKSGV